MANGLQKLYKTEDWWAVWLGLGIVTVALVTFFAMGSTIKGWAVKPGTWTDFGGLMGDLGKHGLGYVIIFVAFLVVFSISMSVMGRKLGEFIPGFTILFLGSLAIFYLSSQTFVKKTAHLGAPLLALIIGLIIGNIIKMPDWFKTSLRTEYYIKTGIVLLGATLPLTLIFRAGPVAFAQATIVSVVTWLTIFFAATKIFGLEKQFGAVLGAGGAVCGVSASIAVGGAVKAHKDHIAIGIAVVSVWAIVMILILTIGLKFFVPDVISPGEAGAWVGTSEFADAAGFAVVAEMQQNLEATGYPHPDAPIQTFTLMKVIGRDIWLGIWCLILAIVSVMFWEKGESKQSVGIGVIWERFPKFVIGFFVASIVMTGADSILKPVEWTGVAPVAGTFKTKAEKIKYDATDLLPSYTAPADLADRFSYDAGDGTVSFDGLMSDKQYQALMSTVTTADKSERKSFEGLFKNLKLQSDWSESQLRSKVISPIKTLRSWAFVICFLCIGLSTRFKDLLTFGLKPFWAFTIGVFVNVPLGFFLSTVVFKSFWEKIWELI